MHDHPAHKREPDDRSLARGHEQADLNVKAVAYFIVFLTVGTVAVAAVMAGLFWILAHQEAGRDRPPSPLAAEVQRTPEPRLQALPSVDLARMRERDQRLLNSYGWVSREGQIARMPVEAAMQRMLQRPYPLWPIVDPALAAPEAPADLEPAPLPAEALEAPDLSAPLTDDGQPEMPPQVPEEPARVPAPVE